MVSGRSGVANSTFATRPGVNASRVSAALCLSAVLAVSVAASKPIVGAGGSQASVLQFVRRAPLMQQSGMPPLATQFSTAP